MPDYTIVTTTATEGAETAEVASLGDAFANESEVLGYSRRMAEELVGLSGQLSLDFDYSNIAIYEGDLVDEELDPSHPGFVGLWVLNDEGPAWVAAEDFDEEDAEGEPN